MSQRLLGAVLLACLACANPGPVAAQQGVFPQNLSSECTLQNVTGVFGFNDDTPASPATRESRAFVGVLDLQPNGVAFIQKRGFREPGGELRIGRLLEGVWTVEADCVGLIDFPEVDGPLGDTVEFDLIFVAVDNASELFFVGNNPLEEADAKLLFRR